MNRKKETICAVVVTYNRKKLLLECLEALLKQTHPLDGILIVDNASSDETPHLLKNNGYIDRIPIITNGPIELKKTIKNDDASLEIFYIRMHENTGGAGGFYEGIKKGYKKGFDWLWLMDDDGKPTYNALQKLIKAINCQSEGKIFNSLVVDKKDPDKICFGYHLGFNILNKNENYKTYYSLNKLKNQNLSICDGLAQFFNSTLLHKDVIKKVGYPMHELFIRGDEEEYVLRIQKAGYRTYTVIDSIFFHPDAHVNKINFLFWHIEYEKMTDFKKYFVVRNKIWLSQQYPQIFKTNFLKTVFSF